MKLVEQGIDIIEVVSELEAITERTKLFLVPSNLDQLHKSGRVTGGQKILASLLNIKPILAIEDGTAKIKDKVRSEKKAFSWLIDKLIEDKGNHTVNKVAILHAHDEEKAKKLEQLVNEAIPGLETELLMLITVAGVHTG